MAVKVNPNRTYTDEEKILITLLEIEGHLRFFKVAFIVVALISFVLWFIT
jgi:hypothetical protein